jgi:glycine dehydrogenase subunit 1
MIEGVELLHEQPVVREFAVKLNAPVERVVERCAQLGVNPGLPLEDNGLLVAITELRTKAHIDLLAGTLKAAVAAEATVNA